MLEVVILLVILFILVLIVVQVTSKRCKAKPIVVTIQLPDTNYYLSPKPCEGAICTGQSLTFTCGPVSWYVEPTPGGFRLFYPMGNVKYYIMDGSAVDGNDLFPTLGLVGSVLSAVGCSGAESPSVLGNWQMAGSATLAIRMPSGNYISISNTNPPVAQLSSSIDASSLFTVRTM
jgi:hypothetical protein